MNQKKALEITQAIFERKVHDHVEIDKDDNGSFHVICSPFLTRKQNEIVLELSRIYKTKFELNRDGFDLW